QDNKPAKSVVVDLKREKIFTVTLRGLKPLTKHYMYLDGKLQDSSLLRPKGKQYTDFSANTSHKGHQWGQPIVTNSKGKLKFEYRLKLDIPAETDSMTELYNIEHMRGDKKYFIVTDYNGTSLDIVGEIVSYLPTPTKKTKKANIISE